MTSQQYPRLIDAAKTFLGETDWNDAGERRRIFTALNQGIDAAANLIRTEMNSKKYRLGSDEYVASLSLAPVRLRAAVPQLHKAVRATIDFHVETKSYPPARLLRWQPRNDRLNSLTYSNIDEGHGGPLERAFDAFRDLSLILETPTYMLGFQARQRFGRILQPTKSLEAIEAMFLRTIPSERSSGLPPLKFDEPTAIWMTLPLPLRSLHHDRPDDPAAVAINQAITAHTGLGISVEMMVLGADEKATPMLLSQGGDIHPVLVDVPTRGSHFMRRVMPGLLEECQLAAPNGPLPFAGLASQDRSSAFAGLNF